MTIPMTLANADPYAGIFTATQHRLVGYDAGHND